MNNFFIGQKAQAARIAACYGGVVDLADKTLTKSEEQFLHKQEAELIIKGGVGAPIGTIKEMGGRDYIKTVSGWKYHGKGGGSKAKEHASGAGVKHTADPAGKERGSTEKKDTSSGGGEAAMDHAEDIAEDESYDINERFQAFELFTNSVIKGRMKSMIAYGSGGVGKTYTVTTQLKKAGKVAFDEENHVPGDDDYDYVKITGKMTAPEVYKTMFQHNGKLLLFDDCDSVLRDPTSINLFKGALDTSGDGTIAYGTKADIKDEEGEKIPKRFKFDGRCIFVSNLGPKEIPQPLKSRGFGVDLTMNKTQTMERIRGIAKDKSGKYKNLQFPGIDYEHHDMHDVLNHVDEVKDKMKADLSVRTIGSLLGIKKDAEEAGLDWKKMASHQLFSKGEENGRFDGSAINKARELNLYKSYGVRFDRIQKSEDVTSKDYFGHIEKGEEDNVEKSELNDLEKAFDTLIGE